MEKLLKIKGFKTRTIKESCNNKRLDKSRKTVKTKYGVDNVSKSDFFKQKKAETFYKKYGVVGKIAANVKNKHSKRL
jgi:hypothetical protein